MDVVTLSIIIIIALFVAIVLCLLARKLIANRSTPVNGIDDQYNSSLLFKPNSDVDNASSNFMVTTSANV